MTAQVDSLVAKCNLAREDSRMRLETKAKWSLHQLRIMEPVSISFHPILFAPPWKDPPVGKTHTRHTPHNKHCGPGI